MKIWEESFLLAFALLLAAPSFLPSQIFVLDILDGVVESDEFFFLPNNKVTLRCFSRSLFFSRRSRSNFFSSSYKYLFLKTSSSRLVASISSFSSAISCSSFSLHSSVLVVRSSLFFFMSVFFLRRYSSSSLWTRVSVRMEDLMFSMSVRRAFSDWSKMRVWLEMSALVSLEK